MVEIEHSLKDEKKMILIYDGFRSHVQLQTLQFLGSKVVMCVALPSHNSHFLQPLVVSVFGFFKIKLRQEISRASRLHSTRDIFAVNSILTNAYSCSVNCLNIINGFVKTGLSKNNLRRTDVSGYLELIFRTVSLLKNLLKRFHQRKL